MIEIPIWTIGFSLWGLMLIFCSLGMYYGRKDGSWIIGATFFGFFLFIGFFFSCISLWNNCVDIVRFV